MRKVYHAILPTEADTFENEWEQCLQQLKKLLTGQLGLFKAVIFIDAQHDDIYYAKQEAIIQSMSLVFGNQTPTFTVLAEAPEKPFQVCIEAGLVDLSQARLLYKNLEGIPYSFIESSQSKEVWATGMGSRCGKTTIEHSAIAAFEQMKQLLEAENLSFNHVVRQWNYISRIVDFDYVGEDKFQHYQIFNEIRNHYYHQYRTVKGYPAATGIGTQAGGVSIDFCAATPFDVVKAISIQNPAQANPYRYKQNVLIGSVLAGKRKKQVPQFERGKLVINDVPTLYVSGTASIIGQETIGINDVRLQTTTTIENIKKLAATDNLKAHNGCLQQYPERPTLIRVYVKYPNDFGPIKQICAQMFPHIPAIYVVADVCRQDLLVEIEGEYGV